MYAYMLWADTTAGIMKMRNGANSAWISLWELDGTFIATDISLSAGTAGAPSLYFTGDTNTGIYSPGADQVAISTNATQRLVIDGSGNVGFNVSSPAQRLDLRGSNTAIRIGSDTNDIGTIQFFATANSSVNASIAANLDTSGAGGNLTFSTKLYSGALSEKLRITGAGLVGIGTSTFSYLANKLVIDKGSTGNDGITIVSSNTSNASIWFADGTTGSEAYRGGIDYNHSTDKMQIYTGAQGNITIDSAGNLGIGVTAPSQLLHLSVSSGINYIRTSNGTVDYYNGINSSNEIYIGSTTTHPITFRIGDSEKTRIDTSGRLLVGTSTSVQVYQGATTFDSELQVAGSSASLTIARTVGSGNLFLARNQTVVDGSPLGVISFNGGDGTNLRQAAEISAVVDGTPGTGDMPGRLVFSTTADGASSPTEAMRISNTGSVLIQTTSIASTSDGCYFNSNTNSEFHQLLCHSSSTSSLANLYVNRQATDGTLIDFRQADTTEGTISVSGTTVSYNGGHLSRWSQLPNNQSPSALLKGTLMSNLDEMCEWGDEDNEQLNKTKISDTESDPNVAGLFVSTSFSEEGPLDFLLAMTGDMIIRIAEGVTVERGDLLMSAGDGTAKPQGDDIIRSKTIAKVTSTNVSCTYEDGSYCVPCVLMAC
jgi:hypothetical protein